MAPPFVGLKHASPTLRVTMTRKSYASSRLGLAGDDMGRRRRYRRSYYGSYVISQRQELTSTFGGIDRDVERLFLDLDRTDLKDLFEFYEDEFGKSAATYARATYPKWKRGSVRMSGQVAERLLNLVPPLLPQETRFELVKKLRKANFRKVNRYVHTAPEVWRDQLAPVIKEVVEHGSTATISSAVKNRVAWLADGDVAAAERLLLAAEQDEAIMRLAYLQAEFQRMDAMIAQLGEYQTSVSHTIDLPQGSIQVHIAVPKVSAWRKFMNWLG